MEKFQFYFQFETRDKSYERMGAATAQRGRGRDLCRPRPKTAWSERSVKGGGEAPKTLRNQRQLRAIPLLCTPQVSPLLMPLFLGTNAGTVDESPVFLDATARTRHTYVVGQTGTGKSVFLINLATQVFQSGGGAYIDPHGDNATELLSHIATRRADDLLVIDLADSESPVGLNFLGNVEPARRSYMADKYVNLFIRIFGETSVGDRSQQLLRNALLAVMEGKHNSLLTVLLLLRNNDLRTKLTHDVKDPLVRSYWRDEFESYDERFRDQVVSPILNKLDAILSHHALRNILSQPACSVNFREHMDSKKILVVMLRKGTIGESGARIMGELIFSEIVRAAFARDDTAHRPFFECIVDEFQNVVNADTDTVLSEARKYGLSLTLANQYLAQIPPETLAAIFGNVGTFISFRPSPGDAKILSEQFLAVGPQGLLDLPNFRAWLRPLEHGAPASPILLQTPPPGPAEHDRADNLRGASRRRYGKPKAGVEKHIRGLFNS